MSQIGQVFPRHLAMVFLLTDYRRRQVWFAYLSKLHANAAIHDPVTVRQRLLEWGNGKLLRHAYQNIPVGFERALQRLGMKGLHPSTYINLHALMVQSEENRKAFSHAARIHPKTIEYMMALPHDLRFVKLAKLFHRASDVKKFTFLIGTLAGDDDDRRFEICHKIKKCVDQNGSVSALLEKEYFKTPFPTQVVPDSANCRYIRNTEELRQVATDFQNCVFQYHAEILRSEQQFYKYSIDSEDQAVICIKPDNPFGWRIDEIRGPQNMRVDDDLEEQIIAYFAEYGVNQMENLETLIDIVRRSMQEPHRLDPVDNIHHVFEELIEDDAA